MKNLAKTINIRITASLLALVIFAALFASCTGDGITTEPPITEAPVTSSGLPEGYTFALTVDYTVIRPEKSNETVKSASIELKNGLSALFGENMAITDDWRAPEDGALEVLIGNTNRPASQAALDALGGELKFSVSVSDKTVVVVAGSDAILPYAVSYLLDVAYFYEGAVYLPEGLNYVSETFKTLAIAENGKANYGIVYSRFANDTAKEKYVALQSAINELLVNKTQTIKNDTLSNAGKYDSSKLEILIGITDHPENAEGRAVYDYDECGFCVVGNKIIITGRTLPATFYAVERFADLLQGCLTDTENGKEIMLPYSEAVVWKYGEYASGVPDTGLTLTEAYDCGDGVVTLLYAEGDGASYDAFIAKAAEDGFACLSSRNAGNERHAVLESKTTRVFVGSTADGLRLTLEPATTRTFPSAVEADPYTTELTFMQSALNYSQTSGSTNGMSYVLQLTDGSYVVWDGGWASDAADLYLYLKQNAPNGSTPHIRVWILTHAHGDHQGCMLEFAESYADGIKLDYIGVNIPPIYSDNEGASIYSNGKLQKALAQFKGAQALKLHSGMLLDLPGADVEVLLTHEDLGVMNLHSEKRNDQSVVTRIIAETDKVLLPGDAEIVAGDYLVARWGDYLKSNYLQVAHHGSKNNPTCLDFYKVSAPSYCFFPGAQSRFNENRTTPENAYLVNLVGLKNIFVADGADKVIKLK
ncbi:MAG: MBL fold metallo-hydrolase [Eubacteriales bacterium]